jgi:hypothetical protein
MPGIVQGEISNKDNPLLFFCYQDEGILRDLAELSWVIYPYGSGTATALHGTCDVTPETGTDWLSAGVYAPTVNSATLSVGAYEIVWIYKYQPGDAAKKCSYFFEVLTPGAWRTGAQYSGYMPSGNEALTGFTIAQQHKAINIASRDLERICGRYFFPKYTTILQSVRPRSSVATLDIPIIGINQLAIDSILVYMTTPSYYNLDVGNVKVFNRHLSGYTAEDDRDNPKIVIATAGSNDDRNAVTIGSFPGGTKNLRIRGVFGYTEPDGSPMGCTPELLTDVLINMTYKRLTDPTGTDVSTWSPSRIASAKTRDQAITFATNSGSSSSGSSAADDALTGNARLDDIIDRYTRPAYVGSAGLDSE